MVEASEPIGIIDIGSNSGRIIVARLDGFRHLEVLESEGTPLRLVHELASDGTLGEAVTQRTVDALRGFQAIARGAGAQQCVAVATAAVREAADGEAFVQTLRRESGIEIQVISAEEEARYGFLGALYGMPVDDGLVMDIGGGSVQLAQFSQRRVVDWWSLPLGALRLSDRFLFSDPPANAELRRVQEHVRQTLREARLPRLSEREQIVGTGGSIRNLAKLDRAHRDYPIRSLHGFGLRKRALSDLTKRLGQLTAAQRARMPGLNASRFDSIVGGAVCALTILDVVDANGLLVSGQGLREGFALARLGVGLPTPGEVRRAAVAALAARFSTWDARLAQQREQAATALQEALDPQAGEELRETLQHAATLLDIGRSVDFYGRHDHTASIVLAAGLSGFSHRATALLAATLKLAEKGSANLKYLAPVLDDSVSAPLARVAALLALADEIARQSCPDAASSVQFVRRNDSLLLSAEWLEEWPLQGAVRRVQQVFAVDIGVNNP